MGYREVFFDNTPPILGKYRCCRCHKWFKKSEIDVDHIIPQKCGGVDELFNLQAMCAHCNRSKQADTTDTAPDLVKNVVKLGAKSLMRNIFK